MADDHPDPLAGIDDVDWAAVDHAYGPGTDVPEILRDLVSKDMDVVHSAYDEIYGTLAHQGTRYSATAAAIPFLLRLLNDPQTPLRDNLVFCIITLALGWAAHDTDEPAGKAVADWLNMVKPLRVDAAGTVASLEQEKEAWIAAAPTKKEKEKRQKLSTLQNPVTVVKHMGDDLRSYYAVQDGIATIVACLDDPDRKLRAYAAAGLAWFPGARATTRPALCDRLAREAAADNGDEGFQATILLSLALMEYVWRATAADNNDSQPEPDATVVQTLQDAYTDPRSGKIVRWTASMGLFKLGRETREQRELVFRTRTDADDLGAYAEEAAMEQESFPYVIPPDSTTFQEFATRETKGLTL